MNPNKLLLCAVTIAFLLNTYHSMGNKKVPVIQLVETKDIVLEGFKLGECVMLDFNANFREYKDVYQGITAQTYTLTNAKYKYKWDSVGTNWTKYQDISIGGGMDNNPQNGNENFRYFSNVGKEIFFQKPDGSWIFSNREGHEFFMAEVFTNPPSIFFTLCERDTNMMKTPKETLKCELLPKRTNARELLLV